MIRLCPTSRTGTSAGTGTRGSRSGCLPAARPAKRRDRPTRRWESPPAMMRGWNRRARMPDAEARRDFAQDVVTRLRRAGFQALWAGGCVRDILLGLTPVDYDVA